MSLSGKLCIGILEEDNPLKSYFCFKPLLVEEAGRYVPYDGRETYPEEGCIRIVPDKNESSHFKARMRRIGLFAVVDLREHPNENDKIRQNKNYHGDDTERNACIIYSDVVLAPEDVCIFKVLSLTPDEARGLPAEAEPRPEKVLLQAQGQLLGEVWAYSAGEGESEPARLMPSGERVDVTAAQVFQLPGFRGETLTAAVVPIAKDDAEDEVDIEPEIEIEPPEPPKAAKKAEKAEKPGKAENPQDKPWISRTPAASPKDAAAMPPFERAMAAQSGLNPKRGRTLQEIIDEKWKHSRMEQLGLRVLDIHTGDPVPSPAEQAAEALQSAWAQRDQRQELINIFAGLEGAEQAMDARRSAIRENAVNEQLNDLEAQRLQMLDDLENLKRGSEELRETLKKEIRREEEDALAEAVHKTEQAQADQAHWEAEAEKAHAAAESVQDVLNSLTDGRFEARLREFAITSGAVQMIRRMDSPKAPQSELNGVPAKADALITRLCETCEAAGCTITRNGAVNLLVCAAQGPVIFSGAPGSGKTRWAKLLASALGAAPDRFRVILPEPGRPDPRRPGPGGPGGRNWAPGRAVKVTLFDDANLCGPQESLLRAVSGEEGVVCVTVQDEGRPLPAYALNRASLIRLPDEPADSAWAPKPKKEAEALPAVSMESLKEAFAPTADALPEAVTERMRKFRADLALLGVKLSRGALNAVWNYCAAAIPLMNVSALTVLDLALAQRAMPAILAEAPLDALKALPNLLADLPRCRALLDQPLPIEL